MEKGLLEFSLRAGCVGEGGGRRRDGRREEAKESEPHTHGKQD